MMSIEEFGPRVGVAVFIVREDGKILFQKRKGAHDGGTWSTPGGHVDFGEVPSEALEETGCVIYNAKFLFMTNDFFKDSGKHYISLWHIARWQGDEPRILEPEKCTEQRWTSIDDMPMPRMQSYDNITDEQMELLRSEIDKICQGGKS